MEEDSKEVPYYQPGGSIFRDSKCWKRNGVGMTTRNQFQDTTFGSPVEHPWAAVRGWWTEGFEALEEVTLEIGGLLGEVHVHLMLEAGDGWIHSSGRGSRWGERQGQQRGRRRNG